MSGEITSLILRDKTRDTCESTAAAIFLMKCWDNPLSKKKNVLGDPLLNEKQLAEMVEVSDTTIIKILQDYLDIQG